MRAALALLCVLESGCFTVANAGLAEVACHDRECRDHLLREGEAADTAIATGRAAPVALRSTDPCDDCGSEEGERRPFATRTPETDVYALLYERGSRALSCPEASLEIEIERRELDELIARVRGCHAEQRYRCERGPGQESFRCEPSGA
jgi:hypothetical protein